MTLCPLRNRLPVPRYGTDLGTPHQQPARIGSRSRGWVSFQFPINFEPGGPLGILSAALSSIREKGKLIYTQIEEVNIRSACADFKKKVAET
jgi:hypothetical protein